MDHSLIIAQTMGDLRGRLTGTIFDFEHHPKYHHVQNYSTIHMSRRGVRGYLTFRCRTLPYFRPA